MFLGLTNTDVDNYLREHTTDMTKDVLDAIPNSTGDLQQIIDNVFIPPANQNHFLNTNSDNVDVLKCSLACPPPQSSNLTSAMGDLKLVTNSLPTNKTSSHYKVVGTTEVPIVTSVNQIADLQVMTENNNFVPNVSGIPFQLNVGEPAQVYVLSVKVDDPSDKEVAATNGIVENIPILPIPVLQVDDNKLTEEKQRTEENADKWYSDESRWLRHNWELQFLRENRRARNIIYTS